MNIALGIDANFITQATTLIKSICCHNKNVKIYVFNEDVPQEWFDGLNNQLKKIDCETINVLVDKGLFQHCVSHLSYISKATFYRFYVADVITDKALYLDCDMVVNESLESIYDIDLNNYLAAAVVDEFLKNGSWEHPLKLNEFPYFNAGMLLVNCQKWKKENIRQQLFEFAKKHAEILPYSDQCVLNAVLANRWLVLPYRYNYLTSFNDFLKENVSAPDKIINQIICTPAIYHFAGSTKPWLKKYTAHRELYWQYYYMEWCEVIQKNMQL